MDESIFADGDTEVHATGIRCGVEYRAVGIARFRLAVRHVKPTRNTIDGPVRIEVAQSESLVDFAVVESKADAFSAAEKVVLGHIGIKNDTGGL